MIEAIQRAYYLEARNPSDTSTLVELAKTLGLNTERFSFELDHPDTQAELDRQIAFARALGVKGFPTLLLETPDKQTFIDIDPNDPQGILAQILLAL